MSSNDIDPAIAALLDDTKPYDFSKSSFDFEKINHFQFRYQL